ncbi:hypothetical protein H0H92_007932 [Tricholoma furcatifolium]|nr:hypothetical protein H0H92_007932 [Tricholoma furcatifolium]
MTLLYMPKSHNIQELTPSGKIIKGNLRQLARRHWKERTRMGEDRTPTSHL